MIKDSEKYAEEDKAIKAKIDARNQFENYIYQMKNSIDDKDKLADKLDEDDKSTIRDALTDAQDWLNANSDAEKDDFEDKLKELQSVCDPIISKVYQGMGGQGGAGGDPQGSPELCGVHGCREVRLVLPDYTTSVYCRAHHEQFGRQLCDVLAQG